MMMSTDTTTRINEHDQQVDMNMHGYQEETDSGSGFGCFGFFCFGTRKWSLLQGGGGGEQREETWLIKKTKKVKEFTEVVAGPKWKNFIRKLGKYTKKSRMAECRQYDQKSYDLNFDDGLDDDFLQENNNALLGGGGGFSTKFVRMNQTQ